MNSKKWYLVIFIIRLIISISAMPFSSHLWSLLTFINSISMVGIIFAILGSIMFVINGGFFYGVIHSFKQFFKVANRRSNYSKTNQETVDSDILPRPKSNRSTLPFIVIGTLFFTIGLLLTLFL